MKPLLGESTPDTKQYPVLIRVTDGNKDKSKKIKLSTMVETSDLDAFWTTYTDILKTGFKGLKKKSKTKKKFKKSTKEPK